MDKETQKKQRFIERLENIEIPQRYSMRVDELVAIYENYQGKPLRMIAVAYDYGFKRGTNYGRKQTKC